MSYDSTNKRIYGNVSIADVQDALALDNNDIGGLVLAGTQESAGTSPRVNKWAKWKPYQATDLDLPTVEAREQAGWNQFGRPNQDTGFIYGVRGSIGNIGKELTLLHNCTFTYEHPHGESGECYRLSDFRHPTNIQYGYRSNAYIDLYATVHWLGQVDGTVIIQDAQGESSFEVTINYNPHNATAREEMLSIKDFLVQSELISHDPDNCYPCVLITNNAGTSYLHCLYPQNAQSSQTLVPTTIGNGPNNNLWKVYVPSTLVSEGTVGTMSIILVKPNSGTTIAPGMDIANWLTIASGTRPAGDAWAAFFSGVPEGCGLPVVFATGGSYGATVASVGSILVSTLTSTSTSGSVAFYFSDNYTGNVTVTITMIMKYTSRFGDSDQENIPVEVQQISNPVTGRMYRALFSKSPLEIVLFQGTCVFEASIVTTINGTNTTGQGGTATILYPMT